MIKRVFLAELAISVVIFHGCSNKPEMLQGVITFVSGNIIVNSQPAKIGDIVKGNDVIAAMESSMAVIQISQTALITVQPNSELKFSELQIKENSSQKVSLYLSKGATYHKVIKSGTDYSVKTPTVVASVRGTSFEVKYDGTKNRINLLSGRVYVEKVAADTKVQVTEADLNAGESIEATADTIGKPESLDKETEEYLNKLDSIAVVSDIEKKIEKGSSAGIKLEIEIVSPPVIESILKNYSSETSGDKKNKPGVSSVKILINKKNRSMADIKSVFNRIDEIYLFSGRVIKGAIIERGAKFSVITTSGVIKISEKDIKTVKVIK